MPAKRVRLRSMHGVSRPTARTRQIRLSKIQSAFPLHRIDALIVSRPSSLRYLTGFTGSNGLLIIRRRSALFFTDGRYREQARREIGKHLRGRIVAGGLFKAAVGEGALKECAAIGFDDTELSYRGFREMRHMLPGRALRPVGGIIEGLASIKDRTERAALAVAADISDAVFTEILPLIRPGVTERDLASEITYRQMLLGAERDSFAPIVASGPRTAMPHARPEGRKIQNGDAVLLDFGCVIEGLGSDLSRTVFLGKPDPRLRKAYDLVRSAQEEAVALVQAGARASTIDRSARNRIARAGWAEYFPHSLGHGIGMEVHERPRIAPSSDETLQAGQVITIEPGVYFPKLGGIRIEDDLVVTDGGCTFLTHSSRELIQL